MATQTVTSGPPAWQLPYLQNGLQQSQALYQNGGTPVVPFSPYSEQAIQGTATRAQQGSSTVNAANDYVTKSLQGGFLGSNPYLDQTFNRAAMATQGQLSSQFAGAGRNIDASQGNRSQQLNDLATQIYGGAYNTDRQLQQQSVGSAIPLANQDYVDLQALRGAGQDVEGLAQEYAAQPANALNQYLGQIGAIPAGTTTQQPLYRNTGCCDSRRSTCRLAGRLESFKLAVGRDGWGLSAVACWAPGEADMGLLDFLKSKDDSDQIDPVEIQQRPVGAAPPSAPSMPSRLNGVLNQFGGAGTLGLQLLANSGYSTTPRSFGQILGQSAINAQQISAGQQEQQLKQQLIAAQLKALQAKPAVNPVSVADGSTLIDPTTGKVIYQGAPKASDQPSDVREYEYAKANGFTGSFEAWANRKASLGSSDIQGYNLAKDQGYKGSFLEFLKQKSAVQSVGDDLSPDDLNLASTTVMTDPSQMKQFASFGKAGQARRDQINSAITQKLKASGMQPSDLGALRANFKAQSGSINKLVPQLNAIEAYEQTAKFNSQRLLDLVDKVDNTGIPVIEAYARRAQKATGDPDVAEFQSVLAQYQTEAARIINNPNLTGVLSDSARHEMQDIIKGDMSAAQLKRVINRLNTEFDFRKNAIKDQIGIAGGAMSDAGGGGPGTPRDTAPTPITKGQTKVINGKTYINLTGQPNGWHEQ
jgi:hypothetical protein